MRVIQHIPTMLTLANLLCGCLGIVYIDPTMSHLPAYFVWAAVIFDFFDGYIARATKATSDMGKQLDSLADMVSFGVLPSIMVFNQLNHATPDNTWIAYSGFLIALGTAVRLAKFNLITTSKTVFIGLPSPANALFITGLVFLPSPLDTWALNTYVLPLIVIVFSGLLIAPINLFAMKFKNINYAKHKIQFIFIAIALAVLGIGQAKAISPIILLYIILSLIWNAKTRIARE